jgi:hypothetical protein
MTHITRLFSFAHKKGALGTRGKAVYKNRIFRPSTYITAKDRNKKGRISMLSFPVEPSCAFLACGSSLVEKAKTANGWSNFMLDQ